MTTSTDSVVTIAVAVEMFFDNLRLAPRSKRTYRNGVAKFLRHLADHESIDPQTAPVTALNAEHVMSFARMIIPPDIHTPKEVSQMRTAQNNLSAVRKLCAYLVTENLRPDLRINHLRTRITAMMPKFTSLPPDVKLADLERIVTYVRSSEASVRPHQELRRLKVRAMILFLFRSGVRVSELCVLRRRDIDLIGGEASIYRAKSGRRRTVYFDAETAQAFSDYWRARGDPPRNAGNLPALSGRDKVGDAGSTISPRTVEHIVTQLCNILGIENGVTPHSFRHGLATEMLQRKMRVPSVQTILGHASAQTTRVYVSQTANHVAAEEYHGAFGTPESS